MDKIIKRQIDDLNDIIEKYHNILLSIDNTKMKNNLNKTLLFIDDIDILKNDINEKLNDFQNNIDNNIDNNNPGIEIIKRIENYEIVKSTTDTFFPYILMYQLYYNKIKNI